LIRHSSEAPWLSASELAVRVGVSQPSVSRLATVLGFDGYSALRESLRPSTPGEVEGETDRWHAAVDSEALNLKDLSRRLIPAAEWAQLGNALDSSQPLIIVGLRASRYLAAYFSYLASKVHPHVVEVLSSDPDPLVAAADAGASAAVVVCMPRYPIATVEALDRFNHLGLYTILIADELVPLSLEATWRLAVPVGGLTFDSHPAAVVTLNLLLESLCDAAGLDAERRLEMLDEAAEEYGTYWTS
jgi:DNA-binding MurR/RpiR family transcriptional regulator